MQFIRDIMTEEYENITGDKFAATPLSTPLPTVDIVGLIDGLIQHRDHAYPSAVEWLIDERDVVFKFEEDGDEITDVEIVQIAGNGVIHEELYDALGRDFVERLVRYARDNYEDVSKWGETQ